MNSPTMMYLQEQYTKIRLLKQSAKSEVWLVTDESGNLYVMKYINHVGIPGRILREHVKHLVYFVEDEENNCSIIIENFIAGKTIEQYIKEKRIFSEAEIEAIIKSLCNFLKSIHQAGIIHRDIKPSNIILQDNNNAILIDFDISRMLSDKIKQEDTMLLGTKGYAPPEQFGYSQTDIRSDIYSLGMTIKEMLPLGYKGYLRNVEKKCHALDPDMRYQGVEEILKALKWYKRRKIFIGIVGIAVILSMVFYGKYYDSISDTKDIENDLDSINVEVTNEDEGQNKLDITENTENETPLRQEPSQDKSKIEENYIIKNETEAVETKPSIVRNGNVKLNLSVNGEPVSVGDNYFISSDEYRYWKRARQDDVSGNYSCIFPDGWYAECTIVNETNKTWHNPHINIIYESSAHSESEAVDLDDLSPGESAVVRFDLSGRIHDSASIYRAGVRFCPVWPEDIKGERISKEITLYFQEVNGYKVWDEIKSK